MCVRNMEQSNMCAKYPASNRLDLLLEETINHARLVQRIEHDRGIVY